MKDSKKEVKFYGWNACHALWRKRPQDVHRAFVFEGKHKLVAELLKQHAAKKRPYHLVTLEDLDRLTESSHHEGICLIATPKKSFADADLLHDVQKSKKPMCFFFLDGVGNPHNLGAIIRTAAHFGIAGIIGGPQLPRISGASARVAEGGLESISIYRLETPEATLKELQSAGFEVLLTSASGRAQTLHQTTLSSKVIWVMGSEVKGISPEIQKLGSREVRIPGTGFVESLNVASAAAILMNETQRQLSR